MTIQLNQRRLLSCILPGLLAGIGMNLSLTKQVTFANSMGNYTAIGIDLTSVVQITVRTFYLSLTQNRLQLLLMVLGLILLFYLARSISSDRRTRIWAAVFAALFATVQLLCESFLATSDLYRSLDLICLTPANVIRSIIRWISWAMIMFAMFLLAVQLLAHYEQRPTETPMHPGNGKIEAAGTGVRVLSDGRQSGHTAFGKWLDALSARRRYAVDLLLLVCCWLPYYVIFWPGTSNEDTVIQLMQYFHYPTYITVLSAVQGPDIYITNHHPFFSTFLFGKFAEIGLAMGDLRLGIGLYCLLHMIFMAAVLAGGLAYLRYAGVYRRRVGILEIIFCVYPLFPLYAICMVKDNLFAEFALLFLLIMAEAERSNGAFLAKWRTLVFLIPVAVMLTLTKGYGAYMLALIGLFWLVRYHRAWKQILIGIMVPVLFYQCIWLSVLLPMWNVAPGGRQEAYSVPFQQTARYVSVYSHEVTDEEKDAISRVLDYDSLKEVYDPDLSDNVKMTYNQFSTDADRKAYLKVWLEMFRKHPGVYFAATFDNIDQYLDVDKTSNLFYYEFDDYIEENPDRNPDIARASWLVVQNNPHTGTARYVIHQLVMLIQKIPVLNFVNSMGLMCWIVLFLLMYNWIRHRGGWNVLMLLPLLTYAVCFVAPDNGNMRYIMPAVYTIPFIFLLMLQTNLHSRESL